MHLGLVAVPRPGVELRARVEHGSSCTYETVEPGWQHVIDSGHNHGDARRQGQRRPSCLPPSAPAPQGWRRAGPDASRSGGRRTDLPTRCRRRRHRGPQDPQPCCRRSPPRRRGGPVLLTIVIAIATSRPTDTAERRQLDAMTHANLSPQPLVSAGLNNRRLPTVCLMPLFDGSTGHGHGWPTGGLRICGRGVGGPYPRIRARSAAARSPGRNRSHGGAMRW